MTTHRWREKDLDNQLMLNWYLTIRARSGLESLSSWGLMSIAEGFDELWYVRMDGNGSFIIEEWKDAL